MPQPKENKHSILSVVLVIVMFGGLAVMALVPVPIFEAVRNAEQASIQSWLGQEADLWVMKTIFSLLEMVNHEAHQVLASAAISGNQKIDAWVMQRIYANMVWAHVVLYRIGVFVMWAAFGIPIIGAMIADGYLRREISKTNFSSQSPVLHKSGLDAFKWSIAAAIVWCVIPWHLSMVIAPLVIVTTGAGAWLWIANAPKRI